MLYRTEFWEKFADYEYVLMYHLDALVFSDQLQEWCGKGLDYIGAPFLRCDRCAVGEGGALSAMAASRSTGSFGAQGAAGTVISRIRPNIFRTIFGSIIEFQQDATAPGSCGRASSGSRDGRRLPCEANSRRWITSR